MSDRLGEIRARMDGPIWPNPRGDAAWLVAEVETLRLALSGLLDVASRVRAGDASLHPEEWFRTSEFAQRVLDGQESP